MDKANQLILKIKILPNSSKNEIVKTENGLKIKITASPVGGKANKALIEFLSKQLKIPKTSIEIIKGETSKEKTVLLKVKEPEKINQIKNFIDIC